MDVITMELSLIIIDYILKNNNNKKIKKDTILIENKYNKKTNH